MMAGSTFSNHRQKTSDDDVFRNLLLKLSLNLREKEAESLLFVTGGGDLPRVENKQLGVLNLLWERGEFSPRTCEKLHSLLKRVDRSDLTDLVLKFMNENDDVAATELRMHTPAEEYCETAAATDRISAKPVVADIEERRIPKAAALPIQRVSSSPISLSNTSHVTASHDSSEDDGENAPPAISSAETLPHSPPEKRASLPDVRRSIAGHGLQPQFTSSFSGSSLPHGNSQELLECKCRGGEGSSCQSLLTTTTSSSLSGSQVDISIVTPNKSVIHISEKPNNASYNCSSPTQQSLSPPYTRPTRDGRGPEVELVGPKPPEPKTRSVRQGERKIHSSRRSSLHDVPISEQTEEQSEEKSEEKEKKDRRERDQETNKSPKGRRRSDNMKPAMCSTLHEAPISESSQEPSEEKFEEKKDTESLSCSPDVSSTSSTPTAMSPTIPRERQLDKHRGTKTDSQGSPKESRNWKRKLLPGKGKPKKSPGLRSQYTWKLEKEPLGKYIWNHKKQHIGYIKCPRKVPVDIGYDNLNPTLSLLLYPCGLFDDTGSSMTLQLKIDIPDGCPPLPPTESFTLEWGIWVPGENSSSADRPLAASKKPLKLTFNQGIEYIHKFLQHDPIKHCECDFLEVRLQTSYSCLDPTAVYDVKVQDLEAGIKHKGVVTMEKLLEFRMGKGKGINIVREIGSNHQRLAGYLLEESTGGQYTKLVANSTNKGEESSHEVLRQWLQWKGKRPVEWGTLVAALRSAELTHLASVIEQNLHFNT